MTIATAEGTVVRTVDGTAEATATGTVTPRTPPARSGRPAADPGPEPSPPLLEIRGLSKRFGALQVLDRAALHVEAGQIVALVGDNGAGKSTLARCIAGALRADAGEVLVRGEPLGPGPDDAQRAGIGVVWQDLALCDNLDTVANLYLGREGRRGLVPEAHLHRKARRALDRLGIDVPDLRRPVAALSGGQRQAIAVARALVPRQPLDADPDLLVLDEPTAALGRRETDQVLRLVRDLRRRGAAVLLITHQLDEVFDLADRIVVLRQGRVVADVTPREVHPDDVVALQSGIEIDSTASRQLRRLSSLAEQLSEADPTASLPLVINAMAAAIGQEALCVHLLDDRDGTPVLRRTAALSLAPELLDATATLAVGPAGGPVGLAASTASTTVSEDVDADPAWAPLAGAALAAGVHSSWAAPIVGSTGVLGTISGYGDTIGRPRADQLELIALYAGHAAASIERERIQEAETLRRSQRLQRSFLSRLSHELRTPLTAIHGCVDTLRQTDVEWASEDQDRFLGTIASESDRMRRLVADLLDASAIESGIFRVHPDWCDLELVLAASVACAAGGDGEAGRVTVSVPEDLGPVWADHDRLEQVFVNLVENALRHTPPDTAVRIEARAAGGGDVDVVVSDDGPGVPADVAATLFEPHSTGGAAGGHGLGLAIARGIATAHGGTLTLDTSVERGAMFVVTLPGGDS